MQLELRALQQSVGITFIFVTHDQEEALTMSDRIAVMSEGRVLQVASPKALYERPNRVEVAGFIGEMNFFDGQLAAVENGHTVVEARGLKTVRVPSQFDFAQPGAEVKVALRPEYLFLKPAPDGDDGAEVRGQGKTSAYLGDRSHIYVSIEDLEAPISVGTMNLPDSFRPGGGGAEVWLSWAPGSVVLLRPD